MLILITIISLFTSPELRAEKQSPRPEMQLILQDLRALEIYLASETEFMRERNEREIGATLNKLNEHLKTLETRKVFKDDPSLKTNLAMITQHMEETARTFKENKQFARYMLQSSLQMCISCHTRNGNGVELFLNSDVKDNGTMGFGDYLLATRQFTKARNFFENKIKDYPGNKLLPADLRLALFNLAILYTRVQEEPKRAVTVLTEFSKRDDVPVYLKSDLSTWIDDFRNWEKVPDPKKNASEAELMSAAKQLLKNDDLNLVTDFDRKFHVRRLRASKLLHRLLETPGKSPLKGEALYLLGLLYHRLQNNLFFRFDEMYFRTCIMDYQKTKIAHDCYTALERTLLDGYTGSSGTALPRDVEADLAHLKKLAN
jgi:hypothetical protein